MIISSRDNLLDTSHRIFKCVVLIWNSLYVFISVYADIQEKWCRDYDKWFYFSQSFCLTHNTDKFYECIYSRHRLKNANDKDEELCKRIYEAEYFKERFWKNNAHEIFAYLCLTLSILVTSFTKEYSWWGPYASEPIWGSIICDSIGSLKTHSAKYYHIGRSR